MPPTSNGHLRRGQGEARWPAARLAGHSCRRPTKEAAVLKGFKDFILRGNVIDLA